MGFYVLDDGTTATMFCNFIKSLGITEILREKLLVSLFLSLGFYYGMFLDLGIKYVGLMDSCQYVIALMLLVC